MVPKLTEALDFHGQALLLRAERQRVIASNIANADTPGYKARDFDFASALRAATAGLGGATSGNLADGPSALVGGIAQDVMAPPSASGVNVPPTMRYALAAQTNLDSNSVDMDRERASFAQNATQYEATLRFINANVRNMLDAMKSPAQG